MDGAPFPPRWPVALCPSSSPGRPPRRCPAAAAPRRRGPEGGDEAAASGLGRKSQTRTQQRVRAGRLVHSSPLLATRTTGNIRGPESEAPSPTGRAERLSRGNLVHGRPRPPGRRPVAVAHLELLVLRLGALELGLELGELLLALGVSPLILAERRGLEVEGPRRPRRSRAWLRPPRAPARPSGATASPRAAAAGSRDAILTGDGTSVGVTGAAILRGVGVSPLRRRAFTSRSRRSRSFNSTQTCFSFWARAWSSTSLPFLSVSQSFSRRPHFVSRAVFVLSKSTTSCSECVSLCGNQSVCRDREERPRHRASAFRSTTNVKIFAQAPTAPPSRRGAACTGRCTRWRCASRAALRSS